MSVIGIRDGAFFRERVPDLVEGRAAASSDLIFYGARRASDLARLSTLEAKIRRDGAIWVVTPKRTPGVRDVDVIAAAQRAGLVDNKVVSFSEAHTALRLVVPRSRRSERRKEASRATHHRYPPALMSHRPGRGADP